MENWSSEYYRENTIVISGEDGTLYKILKITPQSDGGLNIFVPYCKEKKGYLTMPVIQYGKKDQKIRHKDLIKEFFVDKDCKMSIHKSGFVQFSGAGIISGIDSVTNEIKGVGVFSAPLDTPITSGPTFSISLWGVEMGFEKAEVPKKREKFFIFGGSDYFIRDTTTGPTNGFVFEFFIFSKQYSSFIFKKEDELYITWRFWNYVIPGIIMTMKVILIQNLDSFIAILPSRNRMGFEGMEFGYGLAGPTGALQKGSKKCAALLCTYPRTPLGEEEVPSIMYPQV